MHRAVGTSGRGDQAWVIKLSRLRCRHTACLMAPQARQGPILPPSVGTWQRHASRRILDKMHGNEGAAGQVGAQNAGKSSLINAMRRSVQRDAAKRTTITTAALPGASCTACDSCTACAWDGHWNAGQPLPAAPAVSGRLWISTPKAARPGWRTSEALLLVAV